MNENNSSLFGTGLYERRWERFSIDRQGLIYAVGLGLSAPRTWSCKLLDISMGGAGFIVTSTLGLPYHYYLSIVGMETRIGCAEVFRQGNRIGVQFLRELDEDLLRRIIRSGYLTGGNLSGRGQRPQGRV